MVAGVAQPVVRGSTLAETGSAGAFGANQYTYSGRGHLIVTGIFQRLLPGLG